MVAPRYCGSFSGNAGRIAVAVIGQSKSKHAIAGAPNALQDAWDNLSVHLSRCNNATIPVWTVHHAVAMVEYLVQRGKVRSAGAVCGRFMQSGKRLRDVTCTNQIIYRICEPSSRQTLLSQILSKSVRAS